ncbi:zinc finger CCCH domain-containing protein 3 [Chiloscyllium plagiosum]|uniref:zinc finger CCCH domain-containing protein 3 n=1 Tax=Chiloscyllium plagiosum TaxID=36176 RepID=UPI001CB7BB16|nr:zinc finger CCCH domain-containing protein 3 [Chiloscyllium plagiosum]
MEEREALQRQIQLLSALITNHKNVHGDVPASTEPNNLHMQGLWTSSNHKYTSVNSKNFPAGSETSSSWRTKYSLVNKKPINTCSETPARESRSEIMPTIRHKLSTINKYVVGTSGSEAGSLSSKSSRLVQTSPKAQSLLALNSELELKNNKLLALKEKLHKVKMARRMDRISAVTSLSAESPTLKSTKKQDEEGQVPKTEEQISIEVTGKTKMKIPLSCRRVKHGLTEIQHVESSNSTSSSPEASICKLPKTSVKGMIHCMDGDSAGGFVGKFQQVVELSDNAHAGPESSTDKSQKISLLHKIAELDKRAKNDCITLGKQQNVLNSVDQIPCNSSPIKKSKYTWQKEDIGTDARGQNETLMAVRKSVSVGASQVQTHVVQGSLKSKASLTHKVPKKQRSNTPVSSRAYKERKANYVWVSNTAKSSQASSQITLKSVSPKLIKNTTRSVAMGDDGVALKPSLELRCSGKLRKTGCCHKRGALSNKYYWKAVETVSPSKSLYQWKSQHSFLSEPAVHRMRSITPKKLESGPDIAKKTLCGPGSSHYKVKSKTKIIRRGGSLCSPTEKRISFTGLPMVKNRYLLTKKGPMYGKSSLTLKRTSGKGLVQISKHRLRRLPSSGLHGTSKQGLTSSSSVRSPSNNQLINTRYKIVKKNAGWNSTLPGASCSISSKSKKINSSISGSRSPLLNRMRLNSNYRFLQQRWKMKGMRCIGGVLYSVSANRLSKSCAIPIRSGVTSAKSTVKSVRLEGDFNSSGIYVPSSLTKAVAHRHIASRAVQRSLAIIRLAKQKKSKKKEYCMYYNRFGKCNRGDDCPYIHDPEKVAVCTRFLRGTCKKTDGTCPFSHKVSKDKMPVCSYYLRGICSNNNCPYSHVYVSRKAEVCRDFLKGYCPLGAKCKKKHTLVCPEFSKTGSCAQGSKCKLQHLQRKSHKRKHTSDTSQDGVEEEGSALKQVKLIDDKERELEKTVKQVFSERGANVSVITEESKTNSGNQDWLPAFIALHSSTSSEEKADSEVEEVRAGETLGKPIQIKPRF